jgi:hypothetical protein
VIVEGILTTLDGDGSLRIAPMGPLVEPGWKNLILRPFPDSHTYANLQQRKEGVFHVTDDVEMIARAAIGQLVDVPATKATDVVRGRVISEACRWYEFRVQSIQQGGLRAWIPCQVVALGSNRDFVGFCRAKHAVLEAAILATRIHLRERSDLLRQLADLEPLVEKTGGDAERRSFDLLKHYIEQGGSQGTK